MPFYNKLHNDDPADFRTMQGLLRLKKHLEAALPIKDQDENLLIATWNLREFGNTRYNGRTRESLYYIAEVISHFDVVAVQEVRSNLGALDELIMILGQTMWKYVVTDVTYGRQGNDERLAFIYDTRKMIFGGLVGELVPEQVKDANGLLSTKEAFARSPYIVGFRAGWFKFSICTTHSYYGQGEKDKQRKKEMADLVRLLEVRIKSPDRWAPNVILLGDFNIFSAKDEAMKSLTKAFKRPGPAGQPESGSNQDRTKPFDQIGFISADVEHQLETAKCGVFDPYESVYRLKEDAEIYPWNATKARSFKEWRSYQISDHLPKWVQVNVNFATEYLSAKLSGKTTAIRADTSASSRSANSGGKPRATKAEGTRKAARKKS
jgi:endonuclease/exonuclease/phosphatase family metal-dependent hydrolase